MKIKVRLMEQEVCCFRTFVYPCHADFEILLITELRALDLQTGYFSLRQIKHATNNFDPANKIGEGGFGPVYKVFMNFPVYYLVRSCADNVFLLHGALYKKFITHAKACDKREALSF